MQTSSKLLRLTLFLVGAASFALPRLSAQLMSDPVAVTVGFADKFDSTSSGTTHCIVTAEDGTNSGVYTAGPGWKTGYNEYVSLIPGKKYIFTINATSDVDDIIADLRPPNGYRMVINGVESRRFRWTRTADDPNAPANFEARLEDTSMVTTGDASSLRPGRIVWSVGLGSLKNGRGAGSITMRQDGLSALTFKPSALIYENDSAEVEVIKSGGALRQVYANSCLVDITTDNDHAFRLKFYPRNSGQISSTKTPDGNGIGIYTLTGDPLYEYLVENPDYPALDTIRITKITRQGGAEYDTWTELEKVANPSVPNSEQWLLQNWYEKPSGATTVSSPVQQLWTYTNSSYNELIETKEADGTVVSSVNNVYGNYSWGMELVSSTVGNGLANPVTTTYDYYDANGAGDGNDGRLKSVATTGGGWVMYDYYYDFDRLGQIAHVYRPYLGTPATPTDDVSTTDTTTYDYAADWRGAACLPSSIVRSINGTTTAQSTIDYSYDSLTDTSTTYDHENDATMELVVATRKDYSDASHYLTTVAKTFRADADPENHFFPGLVHSVEHPDGTIDVTVYYRGQFDPSTRSFSSTVGGSEWLAMTMSGTTASSMTGAVSWPSNTYGSQTATTESNFYAVNGRSSARLVVHSAPGFVVLNETDAYLSSTWNVVQRDMTATIDGLFPGYVTRDAGSPYSNWTIANNTWTKGRLDSSTDETGIVRTFAYDAVNRVRSVTRDGAISGANTIADRTTTYDYDAAGHTTRETVSGSGNETLVTSRAFDLAGRMTSETPPGLGATRYTYSPSTNTVTTMLPSGATKVETRYADGRLKQITGTAVVSEYYTYTATSGYLRVNYATANSTRLQEKWTDWLGRVTATSRPGFTGQPAYQESNTYDPTTGQLTKTTRTGYGDTYYQYNGMGQLVRTGIDVDNNGFTLASSDRVVDQDQFFEPYDSATWLTRTESEYPTVGSITAHEVDRTRVRLTGLSSSLRSEVREIDINNNEIVTTTTVDAVNKLVTTSTAVPGLTTAEQTVALDGLTISATRHDGLTYTQSYDSLSRPSQVNNPRTGVKTTNYWTGTALPYAVIDSRNIALTTTHYDSSGRPMEVDQVIDDVAHNSQSQSRVVRYAYADQGQVQYRWGSGAYPVSFGYDAYGQRQTMSTYRDNSIDWNSSTWPGGNAVADTTTWSYDGPSGLLHYKIDASGATVSYDYNSRGQVATRTWARGVVTTYGYNPGTGELNTVSADGTPTVVYSYDRLGHNTQVTDVTGTRTLDRCICGKLDDEKFSSYYGNRVLTYSYATSGLLGRYGGFKLGNAVDSSSDLEQDLDYTSGGRVDTLTSKRDANAVQQTFQYGYVTNSDLVNSLTALNTNFSTSRGYDPNRDLVTSISAQWGAATKTSFAYTYTDAYLRNTEVQSGEAFSSEYRDSVHQIFNYDNRGALAKAATYMNGTATDQSLPMAARRFEYTYDAASNRSSSNTSGLDSLKDTYTVDALNQYTDRDNHTLAAGGVAAPGANVVASENAVTRAPRAGWHWGDNVSVPNTSGPFYGSFTVYAALLGAGPNGTDLIRTETHTALVAALGQHFTYDLDGNLTSDGVWDYTWDGENRLISVQTNDNAVTFGVPKGRVEFAYDYADRRVQKSVLAWNANTSDWSVTKQRRYLYDHWNLVAEFNVDPNTSALTLYRTYTWGLDVAGSLDAAGGVGALLQITDAASGRSYYPTYDGNGNVASLVNADTGALAAVYEYSPYGEAIRTDVSDSTIADQPFRFSTKAFDSETGLVYYGERYYNPANGRFLGRDPAEEQGGLNLYGFVRNDPVNRWDYLGMEPKDGDHKTEIEPNGTQIVYVYKCEDGQCDWERETVIEPPFKVNGDRYHDDTPSGSSNGTSIPGLQGSGVGIQSPSNPNDPSNPNKKDPALIDHCRTLLGMIGAKVDQVRKTAIELSVTASQYSAMVGKQMRASDAYSDLRHSTLDKVVSLLPEGEAKQVISSGWTIYDGNKDIHDPDYGLVRGSGIAAGKGVIAIAELLELVPRFAGRISFWGGVAIDGINAYGFVSGQVSDGIAISQYQDSLIRLSDDLFIRKMELSNDLEEYKNSDCDNVLGTSKK